MKNLFVLFAFAFLISSCTYRFSLSESHQAANDFYNGQPPARVNIPANMQGQPNDKYRLQKSAFAFNNRTIKIFYAVSKNGKLGNMYIDGFNINNNTSAVALTKEKFFKKAADCRNAQCLLNVVKEANNDCRTFRDSANCWFCEKFAGGEECSWLN